MPLSKSSQVFGGLFNSLRHFWKKRAAAEVEVSAGGLCPG